MSFLTEFKDKKIVVLGAGMTGLSCLRFLHSQGLSFAINDSRQMPFASEEILAQYNKDYPEVNFVLGQWQQALLANADMVIASPGIDLDKEGIRAVISPECEVLGDVELFCRLNNNSEKPMSMLALTGSNGKSTVVSLLAYLAKELSVRAELAGNIGEPILDLLLPNNASKMVDMVIAELSSFQLETLKSMKAIATSVLNLSDDHLDRHKTLANYQAIKQGIYPQGKVAVINRQDEATATLVSNQKTISFGIDKPSHGHFGLSTIGNSTWIMFGDQALTPLEQLPLAGLHNAQNYMAALALGYCAGWSLAAMVDKMAGFIGLEHRCQRVISNDDIQWINDSKATNVGATLAALSGLAPTLTAGEKLILIAGGDGKGADFSPLKPLFNNAVSHLITLGKDGDEIAGLADDAIKVTSLAEAVLQAKKLAQPGDMVLLSPACASIDMFKNYMVRGEQFIAAVIAGEVLCH